MFPRISRLLAVAVLLLVHALSSTRASAADVQVLRPLPKRVLGRPLVEGADGALYGSSHHVYRVNRNGTDLRWIDHPPEYTPSVFVAARDGLLYCANYHSLYRMSLSGRIELLHTFPLKSELISVDPGWMEIAPDGSIYGSARYAGGAGRGVVYRINPSGTVDTLLECGDTGPAFPSTVALATDGALWVTVGVPEPTRAPLVRIAPGGAISSPVASTTLLGGGDIHAHPNGSLYVFTSNLFGSGPSANSMTMHRVSPVDGTCVKLHDNAVMGITTSERVLLGRDGHFYRFYGDILERVSPEGVRTIAFYKYPKGYYGPMGIMFAHDGFAYAILAPFEASLPLLLCRIHIGEQGTVNLPPLTRPDFVRMPPPGKSARVPFRANDIDADGDRLEVISLGSPRLGSATLDPTGRFINYTAPAGDPILADEFTYTLSDGAGGTSNGRVIVRRKVSGSFAALLSHPDRALDGYLGATLSRFGSFSGRLWVGGRFWNFRGMFDEENKASMRMPGPNGPYLELALSGSGEAIALEGILTTGETARNFQLAPANAVAGSKVAGAYTWMIPPDPAWLSQPARIIDSEGAAVPNQLYNVAGFGVGRMTVLPSGSVRLTGRLPNGHPFAAANLIDGTGALALFAGVRGDGYYVIGTRSWFGGRVTFGRREGVSDADGVLRWHLPNKPFQGFDSGARQSSFNFLASRYRTGENLQTAMRAPTNALRLAIVHGNVPANKQTFDVFADGLRLTAPGSVSVDATLDSATGQLSGSFRLNGWSHGAPIRGVVFPSQGIAVGQFPAFNTIGGTGELRVTARP